MEKKTKYIGNFMGFGPSFDGAVFDKKCCSPTIRAAASHGSAPYVVCAYRGGKNKKGQVHRRGLGGIYISVSENYQRGILKGVCRTLKANNHDACAVCKVKIDENNNSTRKDGKKQRSNKPV